MDKKDYEKWVEAKERAVVEYNAFATSEMTKPDYPEVMQFATNEYYKRKSPTEQYGIAVAYSRIENNIATPAEIVLVIKYYTAARKAFRREKAKAEKCA